MITKKPRKSAMPVKKEEVRNLYREILGGLTVADIKLPEALEGQDRINFAKFCHATYHSPYFAQVIEATYYPLIMYIGQKAVDMDDISFFRATANGVDIIREFYLKWANIYDTDYSTDPETKKFDNKKSFETMPNN